MSKIVSYMQELGLADLRSINEYFFKSDIDTLKSFHEYIRDLAFEDWDIAEYSPYLFAPSADVSGFGGCSEVKCKTERASRFVKFASLYSDVVYLYVDSITAPHELETEGKNEKERQFKYRYDLMCDFSLIHLYSALIERNVARIIPPNFSVCPDCFEKYIFDERNLDKLDSIVRDYSAKAIVEALEYGVRLKNQARKGMTEKMRFSMLEKSC